MFEQARYIQNTFALNFLEQRAIPALERQIYGRLRGLYFPAKLLSQPTIMADAPRLLFQSQHGNSQIVVSDSNVTLTVAYSHDWQVQPGAAMAYMRQRSLLLFDILKVLGESEPLYCGTVLQARLPSSLPDPEVPHVVSRLFGLGRESEDLHDVVLRTTEVVDEQLYSNLTVQNYRQWDLSLAPSPLFRLSRNAAAERGVEVISDLNSRYAYNEDQSFKVTRDSTIELLDRNFDLVRQVLDRVGGAADEPRT